MKNKHVYLTENLADARAAVTAARHAGVEEADISLIARSDIELEDLPADKLNASTDFVPAALQGAALGGATGLLAGLVAVVIPPIGMTLAGAAALAGVGALASTWSSALVGASLPDPIRRGFEEEIKRGAILVVIDGDPALLDAAHPQMIAVGAALMPFEESSAMT